MPENGIIKACHDDILRIEEIVEIAESCVSLGIDKIRITGGEPLIRRGILTLVEKLANIKGVKDLAMTTNGTLLKKYAEDLKKAGLNRVNISLDTLNPEKYSDITKGGKLKDVLEGIEEAKLYGLTPVKLNVVLIKDFNEDEIVDFANITKEQAIDVRFIELMPIGELKHWSLNKYISNETVLKKIPELITAKGKDVSSPAIYYKLPYGKGKVGLIAPISCKFCSNCNRIRLTADGNIKLCLHSNEEVDIKTLLRNGQNIRQVLYESLKNKPKEHNLEEGSYIKREMTAIGG